MQNYRTCFQGKMTFSYGVTISIINLIHLAYNKHTLFTASLPFLQQIIKHSDSCFAIFYMIDIIYINVCSIKHFDIPRKLLEYQILVLNLN